MVYTIIIFTLIIATLIYIIYNLNNKNYKLEKKLEEAININNINKIKLEEAISLNKENNDKFNGLLKIYKDIENIIKSSISYINLQENKLNEEEFSLLRSLFDLFRKLEETDKFID